MELLSNFSTISFYILAAVTVVCSLSMIFNPNLIRAGFTLIGSFAAIAGLYFMLAANFVAVSQVLIYAVGIVLVIIFSVMLCSLDERADDVADDQHHNVNLKELNTRKGLAFIVCSALFALFTYVINSQNWEAIAKFTKASQYAGAIPEISKQYTAQIGYLMIGGNGKAGVYLLPFELISVLLLVVLVGVIILSKKKVDSEK